MYMPTHTMINVIKFARLLLLPWLLFIAGNSTVNIVAANGTPISQTQQLKQQEVLLAQQQAWYLQQQHQPPPPLNPTFPAMPLSAPTTATVTAGAQLPPEAAKTAAEDFPATATLPNGVGYSNETLGYTENSINEDDEKLPSEIQKAVCTVTAGEVRASAEAVTTKKLKGVCGSAELKLAFSDLEAKLYRELQEIKMLLQYMAQQQGLNVPQMLASMTLTTTPHSQLHTRTSTTSNFYSTTSSFSPVTPPPPPSTLRTATPHSQQQRQHKIQNPSIKPTTATKSKFKPIAEPKSNAVDTSAEVSYEYEESASAMDSDELLPKKAPQLKSFHTKSQMPPTSSNELLQEVRRFNNTMLSDSELKIFTYYWKLENFTERIESGSSLMVESPVFSIKGKVLQLKAYFQHLHRDFLYLQLVHASVKNNNRNNIVIDMGGLFKEIANEKVSFKHKISLLNQHNQRSKDLISQEFHNLETGFLIPNSALLRSPFIKNDSLLIQIFLYL